MSSKEEILKNIVNSEQVVAELDLARSKNISYEIAYTSSANYLEGLRNQLSVIEAEEERLRNPPPPPPQAPIPTGSQISNEVVEQLTQALIERYDKMEDWLMKNGNNCKVHNLQNQPNSTQRVYFNYGYQSAIEEILKLFGL